MSLLVLTATARLFCPRLVLTAAKYFLFNKKYCHSVFARSGCDGCVFWGDRLLDGANDSLRKSKKNIGFSIFFTVQR